MDLNNMKVTDLKKELKSRGLPIIGNKSELIARLESVLTSQESETMNENEDSVLNECEDEILGSDLLDGSEGDPKADDSLIDDLLDGNENNNNVISTKPKTLVIAKRVTAAAVINSNIDNKNKPKSDDNISDSNEKSTEVKSPTINLLKTSNVILLSNNDKKEMRAQKFGDNKLSVRAQRFGLNSNIGSSQAKSVSATDSSNLNEKLKKRTERFGAIVSDKLKKIDDKEKLLKRGERFGGNSVTKTAINTITVKTDTSKRAITFSTEEDERKRKRIERFGGVS